MEDLRNSRRPAKSAICGDVFGGAPKYSGPLAAKSDDYGEIFGGIAASCSIPFLDLQPPVESYDAGGAVDYLEIFGGFSGGDFAVDHRELFEEKKKATMTTEGLASSNGRF